MSGFGQASPSQESQGFYMWSLCLGQLEFPPNLVSSGQQGCHRLLSVVAGLLQVAEGIKSGSVPANKERLQHLFWPHLRSHQCH